MNIRNLAIAAFVLAIFLCSITFGQQSSPPTNDDDKQLTVLRLTKGTLREELVRSEIEPRSKRFEMNLRFLRAKDSKTARQNATEHRYLWGYFPEAVITVQFVEYPAGFFAQTSADERRKKADELLDLSLLKAPAVKVSEKDIEVGGLLVRQVEFTLNGQKYIARTFADGDVWYVLHIQPRTDNAGPLTDKLFDSFKFVKN